MADNNHSSPPAATTKLMTRDNTTLTRRQEAGSLVPMGEELVAMQHVAQIMVESGMLPGHIANAAQYLAIMLRARDLKISASAALDNIYPTTRKDKPGTTWGYSAALMKALAYRIPGFKFGVNVSNDKVAEVWSQRPGGPVVTTTKTIEDAAKAGLTTKDNWIKNTRQMLLSRATTDNLRITAADALIGAEYSVEELEDADFSPAVKPKQNTIDDNIIDATEFKEVK